MAIRVPWDKYEVAILIDACVKVINKEILRPDAVKMVSQQLRNKAIFQGIIIDEKYRNENGISMQMNIMTGLIQEQKSGLHNASQLFAEIVKIYNTDKLLFSKLLKEANSMINTPTVTEANEMPSLVSKEESMIDFLNLPDLSYTRPIYMTFDDTEYTGLSNWTNLYIKVLAIFYEQDSNSILNLNGKNINGNGRMEIAHSSEAYLMVAPKEFAYDLYVETNVSASDIIKKIQRLLQICNIDYQRLKIFYKKKDSKKRIVTSSHITSQSLETIKKEEFYSFLVEESGAAESTGRSYSSQINTCENYATEHSIGSGKLYHAENDNEALETAHLLINDNDFIEFSRMAHNAPMAALRRYCDFLNGTVSTRSRTSQPTFEYYSNVDLDRYKKILSEEYQRGFRLNDKLSMKRLRMQWERTFSETFPYDDATACNHISQITIRHGDMVYLPEIMLNEDTKQRLMNHIKDLFESGKNIIYYEALFKEFESDFAASKINNSDMLKTYLSYINEGNMYLRRSYIALDSSIEIDSSDEVRNLLISQNTPMQVDDIVSSLSHISKDRIMWALAGNNSQEFIRNQKGEYFHSDIIEFTEHELDLITEWITLSISDKEYMGGSELIDTIENKLPSIKGRYPFLTWLGLRDVIAYKLRDKFSFKGKIISTYGQELSMTDVFADFAKTHDFFTLDQLNVLKNDLETPIYFDAVYANSLRINKNEFVSPDNAQFDIDSVDAAIDNFCHGEFISIKDVTLFGGFPDAYYPWNHFILQHYVANYSKKYKLIHTGFNAGKPVGAIVKRNSRIETFDEVMIRALAESNISLNSDEALQYLYDAGYIARRSISNIDDVIVQANIFRANKGE